VRTIKENNKKMLPYCTLPLLYCFEDGKFSDINRYGIFFLQGCDEEYAQTSNGVTPFISPKIPHMMQMNTGV